MSRKNWDTQLQWWEMQVVLLLFCKQLAGECDTTANENVTIVNAATANETVFCSSAELWHHISLFFQLLTTFFKKEGRKNTKKIFAEILHASL